MIYTTAVNLIPGLIPYSVDELGEGAPRERDERRWKTYLFLQVERISEYLNSLPFVSQSLIE